MRGLSRAIFFMIIATPFTQPAIAKKQRLAPSREFFGNCVKEVKIGEKTALTKCESEVINVVFPDGYLSFQFNVPAGESKGREIITFVGKKVGRTPNAKDNVRVMMVEDINSLVEPSDKIVTKTVLGGFCAFEFQNAEHIDFDDLKSMFCFYEENGAAISYGIKDAHVQKSLHRN